MMTRREVRSSPQSKSNLSSYRLRDINKDLGPHALGLSNDGRPTPIRILTDSRIERHVPDHRYAAALAFLRDRTAGTEDRRVVLAVRAVEARHVLHHAEDGRLCLLEHADAAHGVREREKLRGGDDDGAFLD